MTSSSKPLVVVADDDPSILKLMQFHLQKWGYRVSCAHDKAQLLQHLAVEIPVLVLLDLRFGEDDGVEVLEELLRQEPGLTVVMLTAHGSIDTAVQAIKRGAYEYLTKPPDLDRMQMVVHHAVEKHRLTEKIQALEKIVQTQGLSRPMWGNSPSMKRVQELVATVASSNATVLILGESGTGKELVARAIHEQSGRRNGPFIPVNVAAMPPELIESTLFGHERGAFTGADQIQKGCCEIADNGTLFLDEICELDFKLQAKLLRFLQERTVQRVGSSKIFEVDVRILSATNRDPAAEVRAGRLREDLFYRLNVVPVFLPPLRERREDIPLLATLFLQRAAARNKRPLACFSDLALEALSAYDWPGNVRQLENLVERMVIFARGPEVGLEAVPPEVRGKGPAMPINPNGVTAAAPPPAGSETPAESGNRTFEQIERQAIVSALTQAGGNVSEAARILGLGQATVYRKIKRYAITRQDYAGSSHS